MDISFCSKKKKDASFSFLSIGIFYEAELKNTEKKLEKWCLNSEPNG